MDKPSDKFYIINCLEGKTEYFNLLVKRYQNHLFNIVNKIVKNSDASEDIVQDAFLRAYKSLKKFEIDKEFFPYLVRIATNCAKDYLKIHSRETELDLDTQDDCDAFEDQEELYDVIYALPDAFREVILLYYRDRKSIKEISLLTSKSIENVKVQLFRARKILFDKLNQ